ncbi:MAG: glycosyltransferase [Fibrobacteria bacterium]
MRPNAKPKILINATTLVMGGGVQIGISFVQHTASPPNDELDLLFALSRQIYDALSREIREDKRVRVIDASPARFITGRYSRRRLREMESEFQPDIVYTLGLPSYVNFRSPEVGRYTNHWGILPSAIAWSSIPLPERIPHWLRTRYRLFWVSRAAYFETQTDAAKIGIMKKLKVPQERVIVIPNVPNPVFIIAGADGNRRPKESAAVEIFCLAAAYRHKNLAIIPRVARILRDMRPETAFRFTLTIPQEGRMFLEIVEDSRRLGVLDMIANSGPLRMPECVERYRASDILFMPTLLETFSVTYLEAMAMSVPIVAADLDFARSICGDAANFYEPLSPQAAADAILGVAEDAVLRDRLIGNGKARLEQFPDPEKKHRMVLDWLAEIARATKLAEPAGLRQ